MPLKMGNVQINLSFSFYLICVADKGHQGKTTTVCGPILWPGFQGFYVCVYVLDPEVTLGKGKLL